MGIDKKKSKKSSVKPKTKETKKKDSKSKKQTYYYWHKGNNFHDEYEKIPITAFGNDDMTPAKWLKTKDSAPFFEKDGKEIYYGKPHYYWEGKGANTKKVPFYLRKQTPKKEESKKKTK